MTEKTDNQQTPGRAPRRRRQTIVTQPSEPAPAAAPGASAPGKAGAPQDGKVRCTWATGHPLLCAYHDGEWGVPQHDDRALFELLTLEGAQAGLNWLSVLQRRDAYRAAFADWNVAAVAAFGDEDVAALLSNGSSGIIRNRAKIRSVVTNARSFLAVQEEFGSFDTYVWGFVDGKPKQNRWASVKDLPSYSAESIALARDLYRRGFRFVGPTICYAFMEAAGLVNDHVLPCFRSAELTDAAAAANTQ